LRHERVNPFFLYIRKCRVNPFFLYSEMSRPSLQQSCPPNRAPLRHYPALRHHRDVELHAGRGWIDTTYPGPYFSPKLTI
jgi:hypothetical protein